MHPCGPNLGKSLVCLSCSSLDLLFVRSSPPPNRKGIHSDPIGVRGFDPDKRIGLPCCTLFTITVTCSLQITLLPNNLLPTISVLADITLLKTTCHFLLLLVGIDILIYQKDYD
jgi:hypothetical protein